MLIVRSVGLNTRTIGIGPARIFRKAIELNPNSVNAHQFARLLATLGRYDEGLAEIHKARELDPRSAIWEFRFTVSLKSNANMTRL